MKIIQRLILLAGFATLSLLLWRSDLGSIWRQVSRVGPGFLVVLLLQAGYHALNAVGWRFCFSAADADAIAWRRLLIARVAGDGVNYLTPSGTIAGELVRPGMLGDGAPDEVKNASVVVAKFSHAFSQALFVLLGLLFVLPGRVDFLAERQRALGLAGVLFIVCGVIVALYLLIARREGGGYRLAFGGRFDAVRSQMRDYLLNQPLRFAASIVCFVLAFAWGALEALVLCHFLGLEIGLGLALAVETLSNLVDAVFFMVPARVGTQEAGKMAIFAGLGMTASQGLAFGLVRHARELLWAGAGLLIFSVHRRAAARASLTCAP